jgi:hypothetical protein
MVGWGRVGHAMMTEMNDNVLTSQFPHPAGGSSCPHGPNNKLTKPETEKEEGGPADEVYYVWVPDDAAFDKSVADHVGRKFWDWKPSKPDQTHCTRAAYDALKAGKVPLSGQDTGQILPGTLGDLLKSIGGTTVIPVTPTTPVPTGAP